VYMGTGRRPGWILVSHGCNRTADGAQLWIALLLERGSCCQWEIGDDGCGSWCVWGRVRGEASWREAGRVDGGIRVVRLAALSKSTDLAWVCLGCFFSGLDSASSVRARREQFGVHLSVCHGNFTTSAMLTAFFLCSYFKSNDVVISFFDNQILA
jgi:hypothetical protein